MADSGPGPERGPGLATVVLAAGSGSRFGALKQLTEIDGEPLLRRSLRAVAAFGDPQVVVLGAQAERARAAVDDPAWEVVVAPGWEEGMGASLRAGLAAVPAANMVMVSLGDLPWLRREAVARVIAAFGAGSAEAARAYEGATPGHPLLIRGEVLRRAREAPAEGLRTILGELGDALLRVQCEHLGVASDVDVPSDLRAEP